MTGIPDISNIEDAKTIDDEMLDSAVGRLTDDRLDSALSDSRKWQNYAGRCAIQKDDPNESA